MSFFSRFKTAAAPPPPGEAVVRASSAREIAKKPILLRAHTLGINDLASDSKCVHALKASARANVRSLILTFRQKSVWTVSKDGSVAIWDQVPVIAADCVVKLCFTILAHCFADFDFLTIFLLSPARSKSSALPPLKKSLKPEWER
jgi:hypothetical protein